MDVAEGEGTCEGVDDCDPERVGDADCVGVDVATWVIVPLTVLLGEGVGDRVCDWLGVATPDPEPVPV